MKNIRMAIAQMNPIVGDYAANTARILQWVRAAEKKSAQLVVFPEMALCGYPVWDLANKTRFVDEGFRCLNKIVRATRGLSVHVLLGFIDSSSAGSAKTSHNAMAWIQNGRLRGVQHKTLLPNYDVFLEEIFFAPAKRHQLFHCGSLKIGPTICEDIWDEKYAVKPVKKQVRLGADLIVNISASPYYRGVAEARERLTLRHAQKSHKPLLYVNQVGGQDDLVFDGRSFFTDEKGRVLFRAPAFEEGLFFFDWASGATSAAVQDVDSSESPAEMYQALVLGVRDYCRKNKFTKVLIGLSGGIDSALVAAVAVDALGSKAVTGVTLPSEFSSEGSWKDSGELATRLGLDFRNHSIKGTYDFITRRYLYHYKKEGRSVPVPGTIPLAFENLQARLRGLELMFLSNHEGRLLLSTGNKSELALGYCTLYGDMAGGLCVLGDVYKTDVYRLARYRNSLSEVIPEPILTKAPSAELRPNQTDQDSLPPYDLLDEILDLYIEQNKSREAILRHFGRRVRGIRTIVIETLRKVDHNEYKRRQTPPLIRVTRKAWFGRRMPITNRFEA